MKKNYFKPALQVVAIQTTAFITASATSVDGGDTGIGYGGGGDVPARAPERDYWDDYDEE